MVAAKPLRGMIAPASLKQMNPKSWLRNQQKPLRGMIAPASLKPGSRRYAHHDMAQATPGHDCPGLIEATAWAEAFAITDWCHSGA